MICSVHMYTDHFRNSLGTVQNPPSKLKKQESILQNNSFIFKMSQIETVPYFMLILNLIDILSAWGETKLHIKLCLLGLLIIWVPGATWGYPRGFSHQWWRAPRESTSFSSYCCLGFCCSPFVKTFCIILCFTLSSYYLLYRLYGSPWDMSTCRPIKLLDLVYY